MKFLISIFQKLAMEPNSTTDINKSVSENIIKKNVRRFNLIKSLSLITAIIALLWAVMMFFIDFKILAFVIFITSLGFIVSHFLVKNKKDLSGRILYLILLNLSVAITASVSGSHGGVEFVMAFIIGLPIELFSWKRERVYIYIFPFFTFVLWVLLYYTGFNLFSLEHINEEIASKIIYPAAIASTFILILIEVSYFAYLNGIYEKELKSKTAEAVDALAAKIQFLSTMSHEIRTPLNAVVGLSYLLKDSNPKPEQLENIEALNYSGQTLLTLINDILDYNKLEGNHVELEKIYTDFRLIAKQISKIHEPLCMRKGIKFNIEISEKVPPVLTDPARINQVFNNFISNAVKFTDSGGVTLRISMISESENNCELKFEVIDSGIGISQENFEKIFEPFSQASRSTTRLYGGTGLGLPICRKIINMMGSEIKLESEANVGSNFYFTLIFEKAAEVQKPDNSTSKMLPFNGETVLLVEDNEINVMVGKQIISKWNLKIDVAYNGDEAIEKVKNNNYSLVLMDIQMPVMNGYDSSTQIRTFNTTIPIIALSASVFVEVKDKIYNCGMNDFVYKPFDPQDLYNKISNFLRK